MADNTLKVRLQSAYKSSADWNTLNPVLKNGEVGYVSSPASMYGWYKIGNGTSTWNQLPYSTYRPLNNGDFDTINVTDEAAGNLIVTGAARFTNTIQGTATSAVNAGTASSASNAAKTTGTLTIKEALGSPGNVTTTFNGSANVTATITVPSHTSHLTNNSGFITSGATVAEANKTTGTLTLQVAGTTKATFNGNTTTYNVTTSDLGIGTAGLKASGAFLSSATKYAGSTSIGGVANDSAKLGGNTPDYYASTSYVNERVANAVHFKGGFDPSNADALKTPVKEIGDMYVATTTGTFYGLELESGDSIIFQSSVAANTNPASTSFIGVEKTVSVTNSGPTLAWNTVSTVGTVEGVNLTVKMPANPNTNTTYTIDKTTSGVTSAYVGLHANGATTWNSTTNLATSAFANPLINALTEGSSQASTADYILTTYVGAGTPTTTWHRRKASLVSVGYAASAGSAPYPVTAVVGDSTWTTVTSVDNAKKFKIAHIGPGTKSSTVGPTGNVASNAIWGQSATVPYIEYDAKGHITTSVNRTITFPPNPNTDYKQGMNKDNTNLYYPTGTTSGDSSTATSIYSTAVTIQGTTATAPNLVSSVSKLTIANQIVTGSGTAARDAGASANPRYFPTLWKYDTGRTAIDGDIVTVKIPSVGGHSYGVQMSIDNGTTYYPIALNGTAKLTTHFPANTYLTLIYEPTGVAGGAYPATGANSTANITKVWRVLNYRDTDSNDTGYYLRRIYTNLKAGSNKIFPYTIILQKPDGKWESLVKSSSTAASKAVNTNGFLLNNALLMYANATYNADGNVGTYNIWSMHSGLIDHRYSFNTANDSTNGTTGYKPIYLTGTIGSDGLFYLNTTKWWVQDLPTAGNGTEGTIYWYIGDAYDYYRMTFVDTQQIYIYSNGRIREYSDFAQYAANAASAANAAKVNNLTVQTAVPQNAVFTDTKVTAVGNHYTPTSSGTFSPAAGGTTTDISTTTLNIITGLQKDAAGHITGVVSGSIKATNTPNTDEKLKMTPASATKFYPAGGTATTQNTSTAYFSSAVYIQGTSVVAANFVGTATTASYAANAAQLGGKASSAFVLKAGDTMSGNLAVTNVLGIAQSAGTAGGISLYNGTGYVTSYGIAFRVTSNGGKHGYVQGDWATYGYMDGATNRGWILKHTSSGPIFSVDGTGNVVANGSLTVGGSSANNTGVRMQYNSTTKSLDFVFAS